MYEVIESTRRTLDRHAPCPKCQELGKDNSGDNLAIYTDGFQYCWAGCGVIVDVESDSILNSVTPDSNLLPIEQFQFLDIPDRKISSRTCSKFDYRINATTLDHIESYHDLVDGSIYWQKIRKPNKEFLWLGKSTKDKPLFGQWVWNPTDKLEIVITEGELDCLSIAEIQECKWPVVSLPNGAKSAASDLKRHLDWLTKWKFVTLCFDNDEAGQEAVKACYNLFPPGKLKIVKLPLKDANDMLVAGRVAELQKALWNATIYRPDGILKGSDIPIDYLLTPPPSGFNTPYPKLNNIIRGLKKRRITLFTAGVGIGKSTIMKEIGYFLRKTYDIKIGHVFLEESLRETVISHIAIKHNIPFGELSDNPAILDKEKFQSSYEELINNDKVVFYDHFGSIDSPNLLARLEYMAVADEVDFILLDHISIVISGLESSREGERKDIDILMTKLRSLVQRTGVGVIAVCHLKRKSDGTSYNEGGIVSLSDLRGSGSLEQISDIVIALERNQLDEDYANFSKIKILKNRVTGKLGDADTLVYNSHTGRLIVA